MSRQKKLLNFAKGILQFLGGRGYLPLRGEELQKALDIPAPLSSLFLEALDLLLKEGRIRKSGGCYLLAESHSDMAEGVLKLHPRGFGFLLPDNRSQCPTDIFIPRPYIGGAVDGDRVEVCISPSRKSDKGPEGRVVRIIERGRQRIAGIVISAKGKRGELLAPLLGPDHRVEIQSSTPLEIGDRVVVAISKWGSEGAPSSGVVEKEIGPISEPKFDIDAAVEQYEIRHLFPPEAVEEAKKCGKRVSSKSIEGRLDLREEIALTIDPASAKDFDDAISIEKGAKGGYRLGVHIADVSYYVQAGSALDREARLRCNSTYFPGQCVPMLPPELSDNLCSLRPGVARLAVSVLMELNANGELVSHSIERSVICSAHRFSYEEAKEVLDGKRSPYSGQLQLMIELCNLLKGHRKRRGTIEFSLPEIVIQIDSKGEPTGTQMVEYDITHQMVEEFMLKANEVVATDLARRGRGLTYRIHDVPDEESLRDFALLARAFGYKLPPKPTQAELQHLFELAQEGPYGHFLAVGYIRSMKLATYSPDNIGHYGLSLEHYCHFTSPIRRYADLVVHRALLEEEEIDEDELALVSTECSERERVSARAEQSVSTLKKMRLLEIQEKANPGQKWKGVITKAQPFGLFFELVDLMLEGFLHISEIGQDYYICDEEKMQIVGERSGERFRCGDPIELYLESVDLVRGEVRWSRRKPYRLKK